jgi:hypothetical protein
MRPQRIMTCGHAQMCDKAADERAGRGCIAPRATMSRFLSVVRPLSELQCRSEEGGGDGGDKRGTASRGVKPSDGTRRWCEPGQVDGGVRGEGRSLFAMATGADELSSHTLDLGFGFGAARGATTSS